MVIHGSTHEMETGRALPIASGDPLLPKAGVGPVVPSNPCQISFGHVLRRMFVVSEVGYAL